MKTLTYEKIKSEEFITEDNLNEKSISIRFGGTQKHFSNLISYIVALDEDHSIIAILEKGCSLEAQEAFFNEHTLFYIGEANKYGELCGISYPDYVADKIEFKEKNPDGIAEACFFRLV